MQKVHEQIKKESGVGHNSAHVEELIQQAYIEYSECDEISAVQNDKRAEIRAKLKAADIDPKAWHDQYMRKKRDRKKTEAYDRSASICLEALNGMKTGELFGWLDERDAEKEAKAEIKRKAKEAAKASKPKKNPRTGSAAEAA